MLKKKWKNVHFLQHFWPTTITLPENATWQHIMISILWVIPLTRSSTKKLRAQRIHIHRFMLSRNKWDLFLLSSQHIIEVTLVFLIVNLEVISKTNKNFKLFFNFWSFPTFQGTKYVNKRIKINQNHSFLPSLSLILNKLALFLEYYILECFYFVYSSTSCWNLETINKLIIIFFSV